MTEEQLKCSPMMEQWRACKERAKEALVLFRLGDFYEAFYDDAKLISKELELTLTQRQGSPMCGVPAHTCESYLDKLLSRGYKVAVAEQMEDPKVAKGLVRREIVRIVTPGTVISSNLLDAKSNNFFVALAQVGEIFGVCAIDLTTSEVRLLEVEGKKELFDQLCRIKPSEILLAQRFRLEHKIFLEELSHFLPFTLDVQENWYFDYQNAFKKLTEHFKVYSLDGLGLQGMSAGIVAAGTLLHYLSEELNFKIEHLQKIVKDSSSAYMSIDYATLRNLELVESSAGVKKNTLFALLDQCKTPMGGRLLQNWIKNPLLSVGEIKQRADVVEHFSKEERFLGEVQEILNQIYDVERLSTKIVSGFGGPKDMVALGISLKNSSLLKEKLKDCGNALVQEESLHLFDFTELCALLKRALVETPPYRLGEGETFCEGYSPNLDEMRKIRDDTEGWLLELQTRLREETQIKNLKVGFTRAFGYYIEVSKGQSNKIPASFYRRQTLVNNERFITEELKAFEGKVLSAEERIKGIEIELFEALKQKIKELKRQIEESAKAIAKIDVLAALSQVALERGYKRPVVDAGEVIHIERSRHPIVEANSTLGAFTANDCHLDNENQLILITGPNMAGKSTYIRQIALLVIMAQIGSFIPAEAAQIGVVDKLFSRIGASDDLSRGQSTFMVEMSETANILNNITSRSLVILDEIGRGTSTYDGISIAWSVAEYILTTPGKKAKTLFATHFWELTALENEIKGAVNCHVTVQEGDFGIVFLHKIAPGSTDRSYGIHVARLAGLPAPVIMRAQELLSQLEKGRKVTKIKRKELKVEEHPLLFEM